MLGKKAPKSDQQACEMGGGHGLAFSEQAGDVPGWEVVDLPHPDQDVQSQC